MPSSASADNKTLINEKVLLKMNNKVSNKNPKDKQSKHAGHQELHKLSLLPDDRNSVK
jgi:hypothetical protein